MSDNESEEEKFNGLHFVKDDTRLDMLDTNQVFNGNNLIHDNT